MAESKPRDAIALLKDDHRKVEELFKKFEKAKGDGRKEKSSRAKSASSFRSTRRSRRRFSTPPAKARSTTIC